MCAWHADGRPAGPGPPRRPQRYAGTDRQVRGLLLARTGGRRPGAAEPARAPCGPTRSSADRALAGLVRTACCTGSVAGRYGLPGMAELG